MAWLQYYGLQLGMSRAETFSMKWGEMLDLINCMSIHQGGAEPKARKKKLSFEEAIKLR